jgi:cytidylate kinase
VLRYENERDLLDASRAVGPMVPADDAIEVPTDGLAPEQVLDRLESLVRSRMNPAHVS